MADYRRVKRVLDCVAAALGLCLLAVPIAVIALLVLVFHGAPVIFTQERVTEGGKVFLLRKFRSMRVFAPGRGWTNDDSRLTGFGRVLRGSSLDELPELWNVLVGDMSIIGPRPLTTDYLQLYTPQQARRHEVRGGLSGLAQVSGRNALSWDDKFDLDVDYVDSLSLLTDLRILVLTARAVLSRHGVEVDEGTTTETFGGSLRSTSVVFDTVSRSREISVWQARTLDGDDIGACEMVRVDDLHQLIRFKPVAGTVGGPAAEPVAGTVGSGHSSDRRSVEVLRLLVNRARGANADFALCRLPSVGDLGAIYAEAGFREVPTDDEPSVTAAVSKRPGLKLAEDGYLCCDLYPTSAEARGAS
ncbi:sugar transferase [Brevibacterium marinum]|uniref:Lipopolysaccharide/colanic/teichoic acid biosynthesis glycosyltransferase n=1 Tax=Brevibacterium marinum TaxID=418643 RepID=A0A846S508_9MICO|nr:sugar transferase [Brevibacterium marinum]NJC55937.1 lipopolysaccharide/colanic/teichoic acid biosynthesis glycosyltransferase [Brevibacterium marinum]